MTRLFGDDADIDVKDLDTNQLINKRKNTGNIVNLNERNSHKVRHGNIDTGVNLPIDTGVSHSIVIIDQMKKFMTVRLRSLMRILISSGLKIRRGKRTA